MLDSLFAPGTKARAIAEHILARASKGRWATDKEIRETVGDVSKQQIGKVRERLREAGLIKWKGRYSRWRHRARRAEAMEVPA